MYARQTTAADKNYRNILLFKYITHANFTTLSRTIPKLAFDSDRARPIFLVQSFSEHRVLFLILFIFERHVTMRGFHFVYPMQK